MKIADCFEVGYIVKTHGLKGEVQVSFDFEEISKVKLQSVFIDFNGKLIPHSIKTIKLSQKQLGYISFEDIDHIDKAEKITKKNIYLPNTLKPKKNKEEFSYHDLVGFTANDVQHGLLGEIIEVKEFPQQFIATVKYQEKEVLFPLSENLILNLDIPGRIIETQLPDGLLDIYLA